MATNNQAIVSSPIQQPSPTVVPSQIRVLVVDDSPDFLEVVCGLLGLEDFIEVVGTATDGSGAIQAASDLHPDVVLMDVQMPYMNGHTTALLLSQHFPEIRVILMSADESLQTRIACQSSGARAFVYKPAFRTQFFCALEKVYNQAAIATHVTIE
ncbi:MAG TPA: response regulator transcription factor [Candidatus Angelobacter sp.]